MSYDLNSCLLAYAVESGVLDASEVDDHSGVGAEEITIITDETQSALDEAISDLADDYEKLDNSNASAEKLVEAAESLESFVGQLQHMRQNGEVLAGGAAKMYLMGICSSLEARGIPTQIFEGDVLGMNASFESGALADYSFEAEEKSEGLLSRLYAMLRRAYETVVTFFKEFFLTIGKSARAVEISGKKLQRISSKLKARKDDKKIKSKPYAQLMMNGTVDPAAAVARINEVYNSDIVTLAKDMFDSVQPIVDVLANPTSAAVVEAVKSAGGKVPAAREVDLPGGSKIKFAPGGTEGIGKLSGVQFSVVGGRYGMGLKDRVTGEGKPDGEVEPMTPGDISKLGGELVTTAGLMKAGVSFSQKAMDALNTGLKNADKVVKKADKGSKEEIAAAREAIKAAQGCIKPMRAIVPTYSKFMGSVAKDAYGFAMASAARYKTDGEGTSDGQKDDQKGGPKGDPKSLGHDPYGKNNDLGKDDRYKEPKGPRS